MKNILFFFSLFAIVSCTDQSSDSKSIDFEAAMSTPKTIELSEFSQDVRYIPLETNDSSILGQRVDIRVTDKYILAAYSKGDGLKVFDKKTGEFLRTIGHPGNDPEGYAGSQCIYKIGQDGKVYLNGQRNNLLSYDLSTGEYKGEVKLDSAKVIDIETFDLLIDKDKIWAHQKIKIQASNYSLYAFDKQTERIDSLFKLLDAGTPMDQIQGLSIFKGSYEEYGGDVLHFDLAKGRCVHLCRDNNSLWKYDGNIRFKEAFIDTIYNATPQGVTPFMALNLGKWHWDFNDRMIKEGCDNKIYIDYILENNQFLYFHFHVGLFLEKTIYCGLYNKKTKAFSVMEGDKFEDTSNNQEIQIRNTSTKGEFFGLIQVEDLSDELIDTYKIKEEDNPVVVLMQ